MKKLKIDKKAIILKNKGSKLAAEVGNLGTVRVDEVEIGQQQLHLQLKNQQQIICQAPAVNHKHNLQQSDLLHV